MRLIDADALLEVARNHLALFDSCPGQIGLTDKIRRDEIQNSIADILNAPTVAASPWHRVEEPPKEVGCYLVVGFDRHWFYDIAEYFPIDNEWAMSENQSDSTYIRYWMHMPEPPKEDA